MANQFFYVQNMENWGNQIENVNLVDFFRDSTIIKQALIVLTA